MHDLRPYQLDLDAAVDYEWQHGAKVVLMRLPTGGGKTVIIARKIMAHAGYSAVIAHRHELVSQLSLALARNGVQHNIIADKKTCAAIAQEHVLAIGRSFYTPVARTTVASVDTMIRRVDNLRDWFPRVTFWTVDEGHHVVKGNKWGDTVNRFTNPYCKGLLPTATPIRADGLGLGSHADGYADVMVHGPELRWLIDEAYLCDYDLVCPTSDLELVEKVGDSGDWSTKQLREAVKRSHLVGDMVATYCQYARGKPSATFVTDVETANEVCARYIDAGVRAAVLTGKTEGGLRRQIIHQLETGQLDQMVAVDVVSEGFDLPALHCGILGRPTESQGLYIQQAGRFFRPVYAKGYDLNTRAGRLASIAASPKPRALLVDHVGNVVRHQGTPDKPRAYSLDRRDKRAQSGDSGAGGRVCLGCFNFYERFYTACPFCGREPPAPAVRSAPAMVDGDMVLVEGAALATLQGRAIDVNKAPGDYGIELVARGVPGIGASSLQKKFAADQEAQRSLRAAMDFYGGIHHAAGRSDREIQKLFFLAFGVDVATAKTLTAKDAQALEMRISNVIQLSFA